MSIPNLRKRHAKRYEERSYNNIESTSNWKKSTSELLKIITTDCDNMFQPNVILPKEYKQIILPEWEDGAWLMTLNIKESKLPDNIKTLVWKIKNIYIAQNLIKEMYVDGFMDTLLHILKFDDYPCFIYPQYEISIDIGEDEQHIVSKCDYGIITEEHKILIVVEDKTMENAKYFNNWKEDQVLGELFVAAHNIVDTTKNVVYPIIIYAIRVIGTLFTFYETNISKEYIIESSTGIVEQNHMDIKRYPPMKNETFIIAYDFCIKNDRIKILEALYSIKQNILH